MASLFVALWCDAFDTMLRSSAVLTGKNRNFYAKACILQMQKLQILQHAVLRSGTRFWMSRIKPCSGALDFDASDAHLRAGPRMIVCMQVPPPTKAHTRAVALEHPCSI